MRERRRRSFFLLTHPPNKRGAQLRPLSLQRQKNGVWRRRRRWKSFFSSRILWPRWGQQVNCLSFPFTRPPCLPYNPDTASSSFFFALAPKKSLFLSKPLSSLLFCSYFAATSLGIWVILFCLNVAASHSSRSWFLWHFWGEAFFWTTIKERIFRTLLFPTDIQWYKWNKRSTQHSWRLWVKSLLNQGSSTLTQRSRKPVITRNNVTVS